MRKLVLGLLGASTLAISSAASAVVILPGAPTSPTDPTVFRVSTPGNVPVTPAYTGPISATIGHTGIAAGTFTDLFEFTIGSLGMGTIGSGSGSVTTSGTIYLGIDDLDLTSVIFNNGSTNFTASLVLYDAAGAICGTSNADRSAPGTGTCGISEAWALTGVPITGGVLNTLTVTGLSRGLGSYGGTLTFTPGVPEPATWAMMLLGFAGIGFQLRRKRSGAALAQFA